MLPCSCVGRDSALFSRTKVSRYNAHVLSSIVTIEGFVEVLRCYSTWFAELLKQLYLAAEV
jgi:hypothetical protein